MELGNYIENALKNRKKSKVWLCEELNSTFYTKETEIAYKTFVAKLSNNTISGIELLYISHILELNLEKIKLLLKKQIFTNNKGDVNMDSFTKVLKQNSSFKDIQYVVCINSEKENEHILFSENVDNNFVGIEAFNLKDNKMYIVGSIDNLESVLLDSEVTIEEYSKMPDDERYEIISDFLEEFYSLFPESKPTLYIETKISQNPKKKNYMNTLKYMNSCTSEISEILGKYRNIELLKSLDNFMGSETSKSTEVDIILQYEIWFKVIIELKNINDIENAQYDYAYKVVSDSKKEFIETLDRGLEEEEIEQLKKDVLEYGIII